MSTKPERRAAPDSRRARCGPPIFCPCNCKGSCNLVVENAQSAAPLWSERAAGPASLPGFVVWHCARILDWGLNAVVREQPEVATAPRWRERIGFDRGHGAGLTQEQADAVAGAVTADDVTAYAGDLRVAVDQWLSAVSDSDLERVVDVRAACATNPMYATPAAWAEVEHLDQLAVWQFLARPCVAHIRVHSGELSALLTVLSSRVA